MSLSQVKIETSSISKASFESTTIAQEFIHTAFQLPDLAEHVSNFSKINDLKYDLNSAYIISYDGFNQQTVVIPTVNNEGLDATFKLVFFLEDKIERGQAVPFQGAVFTQSQLSPLHDDEKTYNVDFYHLTGELFAETIYDAVSDKTLSAKLINSNIEKGWWSDFTGCIGGIIGRFDDGDALGSAGGIACLIDGPFCAGAIAVICGAGSTYMNWCGGCGSVCYSCIPHP